MFLYSIAIKIYIFLIHLAAPFNAKASKAIEGRKGFFKRNQPNQTNPFIWVHCSSLGEFEQGRPLIEKIKKDYPDKKILLSFFSPSGFEVRKNYPYADEVIYLPFDSAPNAKKLLQHYKIELAIFVKYDLWPFYLAQLLKNKIPIYLVSAVFRKNNYFFKWYGGFLKKMLLQFDGVFVQDEQSKSIGESNGLNNIEISGDVRVDRVLEIKGSPLPLIEVKGFLDKKNLVVFGSIYDTDEAVINYFVKNVNLDYKIVLAPHEISAKHIEYWKRLYPDAILYSELGNYSNQKILIVDNVGKLNSIYQFADLVYIGGGFGKTIHNILEPAVYNIPVFFGPRFQKFQEAKSLLDENLAFTEDNPVDIAKTMITKLKKCDDPIFQKSLQNWFESKSGATDLIMRGLSQKF